MSCCSKCAENKTGCAGRQPSTGGMLDSLTVTAADTGAKRLAKELGMFALLTSPAWLLLLMLPKRNE